MTSLAPSERVLWPLRLPTMRGQFSELADGAARDQMTYRGFLAELLMAECDDRNRRCSERRIKAAGFPRGKALRTFEFDANPAIDPAAIHTLASCDWVRKGLPLCRLCAAIVDRLTFGGNIIETGSDSYRLAHTKARQQATAVS